MDPRGFGFLLTVLAGVGTCCGSITVFFAHLFHGKAYKLYLSGALSSAGGVMLFISFADILPEALDHFGQVENLKNHKTKFAYLFFFTGCLLAVFLDFITAKCSPKETVITDEMMEEIAREHDELQQQKRLKAMEEGNTTPSIEMSPKTEDELASIRLPTELNNQIELQHERDDISAKDRTHLLFVSIITAVALSVHNFPEGLATYTAAVDDQNMGIALGIAMIVHNIPEGMAVAIPTYFATKSKKIAVLVTAISGAAQPIGAFFGWLILKDGVSHFVFGMMFGLVAGIMTFITLEELLPNANKYDPEDKVFSKFLFIGMLVVALIIMFI